MSKKEIGQLILVGFGQFDLKDMMKWVNTDRENELIFAPDNHPPRYRAESSCSQEDLETFVQYVSWASNFLKKIYVGKNEV